jgi:hypothetical protein
VRFDRDGLPLSRRPPCIRSDGSDWTRTGVGNVLEKLGTWAGRSWAVTRAATATRQTELAAGRIVDVMRERGQRRAWEGMWRFRVQGRMQAPN